MSDNKYAGLKLKNQIGFPLYAAAREVTKLYRPYLEKIDLTYTQYVTMIVLWEEKKISAKELGKKLFLDSGTLTPVLKSLEAKGVIKRYRDIDDERVLIIEITDQGVALKDKAVCVPEAMSKAVALEPDEIIQLYKLLYKLLGSGDIKIDI